MVKLVALILPLGLDSFALAAALGVAGLPPHRRLRISLLIAGFEAGMPLIGLAVGAPLGHAFGAVADYVAITILIAFGLFTVLNDDDDEDRVTQLSQRHGAAALLLGLSVSLDELAIGFTIGLLHVPVGPVIAVIAIQAFVLSQIGLRLGARVPENLREGAERLAGIALILIGGVLLIDKLATA